MLLKSIDYWGWDVKFSALFHRFSADYAYASALSRVVIGYHVLTPNIDTRSASLR
jgi:hypothetical protein